MSPIIDQEQMITAKKPAKIFFQAFKTGQLYQRRVFPVPKLQNGFFLYRR
jgi:hypothetical protein